jgi:hypothetical protein
MPVFQRVVTVLAWFVVAGCAAPVTNVKLDTPAPPTGAPYIGPTSTSNPRSTPSGATTPAVATSTPAATPERTLSVSETPLGSAWTELTAGGGPTAREDHTWTVDGEGAFAYLFGGWTDAGPSNELWSFDLATNSWTEIQPDGASPAPRFGHTATWVDDLGLVVWSGQGRDGFFADLNVYNPAANTWTELSSLGAAPDARYGSCASLGPDGELWISHGFTAEGRFSDTRSYDFTSGTWTDRTPVGKVPIERCLHDCFWSAQGRLVLFAGQTNGVAALGDIWAFDPVAGSWTEGVKADSAARQLYALAVTEDAAVIFGGTALDGAFLDDAWIIGDSDLGPHLTPFAASPAPPARAGATFIVDAQRDRLLLYGGKNADGVLGDIWELSRP